MKKLWEFFAMKLATLHHKERADGLWTLPGGWADINESPSEAVSREIREESGLITCVKKLLAFYDKHKHDHPSQLPHAYKVFFLYEIIGGDLSSTLETSEGEFFSKSNIPPLSTHRVTKGQILKLFEYIEDPNLPSDFD